jgi:hypothetical protein
MTKYNEGNVLSIVAGIITLVTTYLFSWYITTWNGATVYAYGVAAWQNVLQMLSNPSGFGSSRGMQAWIVIILAIVLIIFLISGVIQMAGLNSSSAAIVGSILPILVGLMFFLYSVNVITDDWQNLVSIFWSSEEIIADIFPLTLKFAGYPATVGTYLLLIGGFLGLIGGL